ncbi:MAG: S-methyl-5-thioribose-1-phosphate isomerase [Candidatus Omnitrophica bacterium]|nr:S-methyl-5-thioribose-1-phosphate isomerase [Candidatus Omnitrophota bacterium]
MPFPPLRFEKDVLKILDQRQLPLHEVWIECRDSRRVHWAIQHMAIRGAPAIGIAGGYGLWLGIRKFRGSRRAFFNKLRQEAAYLKGARPTGVNLRNVIDRIMACIHLLKQNDVEILKKRVLEAAQSLHKEDDLLCRRMGRHGARLFKTGDRVLTHCNAGGLATSGYGTALGVLYAAKSMGKKITVYAAETRPLLQGARLTAWELLQSDIPCTLVCDNAVASLMRAGKIDRVIVGADRIARNGDTANKIGTYSHAVLAKVHNIPFYVAAPRTTFDFTIRSGKGIPIEARDAKEVSEGFGPRITPHGVRIENPAFDVTPHSYISAFITEAGILRPPFQTSFKKLESSLQR